MASRRLASRTLFTTGLLVAVVACGSRTGLFSDQDFDSNPRRDAGVEEAGVDARVACVPGQFTFQLALTQLMFTIDRSGSMAFTLDGRQRQPRPTWRWAILQNSLAATLTTFDNQIAMGAKFFPQRLDPENNVQSEEACAIETGIDIAPAQGNADNILRVFDTTTPVGGTPTSEAIRVSADALIATRSVAKTIVLATDGAPNCNEALDRFTCTCTSAASVPQCSTPNSNNGQYNCLDDLRTVETIRRTYEELGIPVFVIGIGSIERPDLIGVLDQMAVAGGRPQNGGGRRHYSANSQEELTSALTTIRDTVSGCTYLTPSAPNDPDAIVVTISGARVPRDTTKQNGWDWIDQRLGSLAFFGAACTAAQSASAPTAIGGTVVCADE